ncbi:MAG TPA: HAD hydrolase-like protein [Acidimicrobiales bacterium]|nr:HAD hydrolase-like protein [Acidimicrobiales bacterium]
MTDAPPSLVIWDLDGTIADSAEGILVCLRASLAAFGHPPEPESRLRGLIGPPLDESFGALGFAGADLVAVVDDYRRRYDKVGVALARPYAGVPEAMAALADAGVAQRVATAKRVDFAVRMLDGFGLSRLLEAVEGASLDGRLTAKTEIVAAVLGDDRPERAWMVGDRRHDVVAALDLGLTPAGALWGYGGRAELESAGATWLVERPGDLLVGLALPERG